MTAKAQELFSTEDGRLAMTEAEGRVSTTVADLAGEPVQQARMAFSELLSSMQALAARFETLGGANRPIEVLLGFAPEGEQLYAAVTERELTFVEIAPDGVGRRFLCGPYPVDEARRMVEAVIKANA